MGRLDGKVALITGASRGLGRGIALAFAAEGAAVGVNFQASTAAAKEVASAIERGGGRAALLGADVTDPDHVQGMVGRLVEAFGRVDILVNNAGLLNRAPIQEMSVETWDRMIAVHLRGMFLCTRFAVPHMLRQGGGAIINMTGTFGIKGGEFFTHLSAAKAGMIGFTRALAREVGPHKIRVNAICPAMIRTELIEHLPQKALDDLVQTYPLRRIGEVEDVVKCALFLASSDADFITGQTLAPAGGDVMP